MQGLALSESLINIGDAPPSCQHHRWPCDKTANPGWSQPSCPPPTTSPLAGCSAWLRLSHSRWRLASGTVLPWTLRGPEQRWRSSAGLSQVSGGREALTGPPLPSTAPEVSRVICGFAALKSEAVLLEQGEENILAAKCLERGPRMAKLKNGKVPLSSLYCPNSQKQHLTFSSLYTFQRPCVDVTSSARQETAVVEWTPRKPWRRTPGLHPVGWSLQPSAQLSHLSEGRNSSFLTGFLRELNDMVM